MDFCDLQANLQSKFGHNYKSVIYGSVKIYWIGPQGNKILGVEIKPIYGNKMA